VADSLEACQDAAILVALAIFGGGGAVLLDVLPTGGRCNKGATMLARAQRPRMHQAEQHAHVQEVRVVEEGQSGCRDGRQAVL
jgi:hypothetical protein